MIEGWKIALIMCIVGIITAAITTSVLKEKIQVPYSIEKVNVSIQTMNKETGVEFFRLRGPETDCLILVNVRAQAGAMAMNMRCK